MLDLHHLPGSDLHESKIFLFRRHPITLLPLLFILILLFLLPPAGYLAFQIVGNGLLNNPANLSLYLMLASALFLMGWLFAFQIFIEYWLDIFIVTDKRILDIDQKGLFSRTVSELRLYRTQDVTSEIHGFWQTIFDYGDIFIQTAGEQEHFHFERIPHPNLVAKMILELSEADRKEHLEDAVEDFAMADKTHPHEAVARKMEP